MVQPPTQGLFPPSTYHPLNVGSGMRAVARHAPGKVALDCAGRGRFYRRFVLRGMKGSFRRGAEMINQASQAMARQAEELKTAGQTRKRLGAELDRTVKAVAQAVEHSAVEIRSTATTVGASRPR